MEHFYLLVLVEIEKAYVNLHRTSPLAGSIDFKALNGKAKITAANVVRS